MSFSFHPEAKEELTRAVEYYEEQLDNLGLDFSTEVYSAIQRIVSHPEAWPKLTEEIRRCLVNRFPYGVLYTEEDDEIYIVAVMNLHQKPGYWRKRLE